MNTQEFRKLIREEIRNIINESKSTNTKNQPKNGSKKSLKEGYAWERSEHKFGQPLPTLASVQKAYQSKHNITEASKGELTKLLGVSGDVKTAVEALETMLANQLTTAGLARNARKLAELIIDIIDAAKDEQRNEISDN